MVIMTGQEGANKMKPLMPPLIGSKRLLLSFFLCLLAVCCNAQDANKTIPIGPDAKADLLVYFRADATSNEIDEFLNEYILLPNPTGKGFRQPDGVKVFMRIFPPVQGHEGIALRFFPDDLPEKKDKLKKAIENSPIIYKILEDVAPSDVKSFDTSMPAEPNRGTTHR
jgi:hypothetical protein